MQTTVTNSPVQTEVALRTLSSDLNSIARGATAPVPESIKVTSQASDETEKPAKAPRKIGKTIFMILVLILALYSLYLLIP